MVGDRKAKGGAIKRSKKIGTGASSALKGKSSQEGESRSHLARGICSSFGRRDGWDGSKLGFRSAQKDGKRGASASKKGTREKKKGEIYFPAGRKNVCQENGRVKRKGDLSGKGKPYLRVCITKTHLRKSVCSCRKVGRDGQKDGSRVKSGRDGPEKTVWGGTTTMKPTDFIVRD